jgi:hypothetical protein
LGYKEYEEITNKLYGDGYTEQHTEIIETDEWGHWEREVFINGLDHKLGIDVYYHGFEGIMEVEGPFEVVAEVKTTYKRIQ